MVSPYYCVGEFDGVVTHEARDKRAAAAIVFTGASAGRLKETKTMPRDRQTDDGSHGEG